MTQQKYFRQKLINTHNISIKLQVLPSGAFEDLDSPDKQDVEEATGNEGATMTRWYKFAAIIIWPSELKYAIRISKDMLSSSINDLKVDNQLVGQFFSCIASWLVGWLVGWCAGWLVGGCASWLVGLSINLLQQMIESSKAPMKELEAYAKAIVGKWPSDSLFYDSSAPPDAMLAVLATIGSIP